MTCYCLERTLYLIGGSIVIGLSPFAAVYAVAFLHDWLVMHFGKGKVSR